MQMKNQFHYSLLIDFFIAITLREVLSNHLLKVIINNIVVWQLFCTVFNTSLRTYVIAYFYFV